MRNSIWDFILGMNAGVYLFSICLWVYMTYQFPIQNYINGYLWGSVLYVCIMMFILQTFLFFKKTQDVSSMKEREELRMKYEEETE